MDDYLRFYETYLSEPINGQGKNRTTTCPFCEKEDKFAINIQTSEAQCLSASCGEKVNHITFLTKFHEAWHLNTTEDQLEELSSARGISVSTLEKARLAYDAYSDRWLIPYKNPNTPNLTNLGYFQTKGKNAYRIYKAPNINDSLPLSLYNPYQLHKAIKTDTLFIAEGEWDTLAMMDLLKGKQEIVIGVPGALIFPEASRKWFDKIAHVNLVYDNDEAGAMGIAKAADILQRWNKKVKAIDWSAIEEAEDGFDVRDMRVKHSDSAYESIKASLYDYSTEQVAGQDLSAGYVNTVADIEEVESFDQYVDMYGQQMFLSEENIKSMAITMAIATSQYMPGESLWFFLVGQPGCIAGHEQVKINRAGKTFTVPMAYLHYMMNGGSSSRKTWDTNIPTRIQTMNEDGTVRLRKIVKSLHRGVQLCYRITLINGTTIDATADHDFLVYDDRGENIKRCPLQYLSVGDLLPVNTGRSTKGPAKKNRYAFKARLKYHPYQVWGGVVNGYKVATHRLVVEAEMNGLPLEDYIHCLRHDEERSSEFTYIKPTIHVHHIDRDHTNNSIDNLELMTASEHQYEHAEENTKNVLEQVTPVAIQSIEAVGYSDVYDLKMRAPHNFIVNGIVVGNSGKTTLIESYGGNNEYFDYASRVTSKSLVSGWNSGPEASLITKMNGKVFFIKDFTVVLGMPKEQKKEVFNLFRDIYDGTLKITFGNGKVIDLSNLRFNMIAGVTDAIKAQSDASMGERFLRYDFMGNECDDESIIDSALAGFGQFSTRKNQLTDATLGYVKTLMRPENRWDTDNLPRLSDDSRRKLSTLARYTAYIRTRPETDRNDGLVYRPRKEVASRLALQYAKLAYALEKVFFPGIKGEGGILDISDRTCQLIAKVAHDTAEGFSQDIMQMIHQRPKISRKDLEIKLRLPQTRIHREITDLKTLGLIQTLTLSNIRPTRDGSGKGRPSEMYKVHPDFAPLMDDVLGVKNGTTIND